MFVFVMFKGIFRELFQKSFPGTFPGLFLDHVLKIIFLLIHQESCRMME